MPLYEYKCKKCGSVFEVIQKLSDTPIKNCLYCKGPVKKIINAPAIQFKGNGWYVTDYARKGRTDQKPTLSTKGKSSKESVKEKKNNLSPKD